MTAEQFLINSGFTPMGITCQDLDKYLIEFAKYHVEKALKAQGKLAKQCMTNKSPLPSIDFLKTAYPLENIK